MKNQFSLKTFVIGAALLAAVAVPLSATAFDPARQAGQNISNKGDFMKTTRLAVLLAMFTMLAGVGSAEAGSYSFNVKNNLNMYTANKNPGALCNVTVDARTGSGVVATKIIQGLTAQETRSITLTSTLCNLISITAACSFKDYAGTQKQESKNIMFNCKGGDVYISPTPFGVDSFTSFEISLY